MSACVFSIEGYLFEPKYLFPRGDPKPPETVVQLSFANQEGKLVGMGGWIYL